MTCGRELLPRITSCSKIENEYGEQKSAPELPAAPLTEADYRINLSIHWQVNGQRKSGKHIPGMLFTFKDNVAIVTADQRKEHCAK